MTTKILRKIVNYEVVKESPPSLPDHGKIDFEDNVIHLQALLKRPEELEGSTYKVTTPMSEHALYITINDVTIHKGAANEYKRPFEIFINSKNMDNFAWIVALTRVISAIFRKGGDITFLVEELRSVFDPRGGYYKPGGKWMPSLVAEIGECIEKHLIKIGMIHPPQVTEEVIVKRERAHAEGLTSRNLCPKCNQLAVVRMDGCDTCLECGYSKCG